ncbi:MAG: ribonuclease P protein component [Phycisphaerales bacterium]|jgi:ribonuclease P protein component|nr:ribonuclease P protein component [Phycisphaerales bacterium]
MHEPTGSLGRRERIRAKRDFTLLLRRGQRVRSGPLQLYMRPSDATHSRLGMAVSRRVGNAVRRNRIKRLVRAAFRVARHHCKAPLDLVVVVSPHEPAILGDYTEWLTEAIQKAQSGRERPA